MVVVANHKKEAKKYPVPQDIYLGGRDAMFVLALVAVRRSRRYHRGTRSLNVNYDLVKKKVI